MARGEGGVRRVREAARANRRLRGRRPQSDAFVRRLCRGAFPGIFGAHPDFAKIDWGRAEWFKSGQPWKPDHAKSLAENGLGHKDVLRFRTPGLTGLSGSCS